MKKCTCRDCGREFFDRKNGAGRMPTRCDLCRYLYRQDSGPRVCSLPRHCAFCGAEFTPRDSLKSVNNKYCSQTCRHSAEAKRPLGPPRQVTCSHQGCDEKIVGHERRLMCEIHKHFSRDALVFCSPWPQLRQCVVCASSFTPRDYKQETCGGVCSRRKPRAFKVCEWCKKEYAVNQSKEVSDSQRWCSQQCRYEQYWHEKPRPPVTYKLYRNYCGSCCKYHWDSKETAYCAGCLERYGLWHCTRRSDPERHTIECRVCGVLFADIIGGQGRTIDRCSDACDKAYKRKARGLHRRNRGSRSHRSRAKRYGVIYKSVKPNDVFQRDKWRCQACGCDTPQTLRGTTADDAPELDHIIPISRGGAHTGDNLQLLCRTCNILKADMPMSDFVEEYLSETMA